MSGHKNPDKHGEVQQLAESILSAENEADGVKSDYQSKVSELLKKGREKSVEMRESYDKKAAETKNRILSLERQKTEKMVQEIISKAREDADSLKGKKLGKKELDSVFQGFVSKL